MKDFELMWETQTRISFFLLHPYFHCSLFALMTSCSSFWLLHRQIHEPFCTSVSDSITSAQQKRWETEKNTLCDILIARRISYQIRWNSKRKMPKYSSESCHSTFTSVTVIYTRRVCFHSQCATTERNSMWNIQ